MRWGSGGTVIPVPINKIHRADEELLQCIFLTKVLNEQPADFKDLWSITVLGFMTLPTAISVELCSNIVRSHHFFQCQKPCVPHIS